MINFLIIIQNRWMRLQNSRCPPSGSLKKERLKKKHSPATFLSSRTHTLRVVNLLLWLVLLLLLFMARSVRSRSKYCTFLCDSFFDLLSWSLVSLLSTPYVVPLTCVFYGTACTVPLLYLSRFSGCLPSRPVECATFAIKRSNDQNNRIWLTGRKGQPEMMEN